MRGINKEKGLASSSQALAWGFQITDDCLCQWNSVAVGKSLNFSGSQLFHL